jgi:hypothetical protein
MPKFEKVFWDVIWDGIGKDAGTVFSAVALHMILVPILGALGSTRFDSSFHRHIPPLRQRLAAQRRDLAYSALAYGMDYDYSRREAWNDEWELPSCIYVDETESNE